MWIQISANVSTWALTETKLEGTLLFTIPILKYYEMLHCKSLCALG